MLVISINLYAVCSSDFENTRSITPWIVTPLSPITIITLHVAEHTGVWGYGTNLCEDWWFMMCNHSGIFTVKRDRTCVIVEGLFRLYHMIVQFFHSTFKYAAKVPWNQVSSYCWKSRQQHVSSDNHQSSTPPVLTKVP